MILILTMAFLDTHKTFNTTKQGILFILNGKHLINNKFKYCVIHIIFTKNKYTNWGVNIVKM